MTLDIGGLLFPKPKVIFPSKSFLFYGKVLSINSIFFFESFYLLSFAIRIQRVLCASRFVAMLLFMLSCFFTLPFPFVPKNLWLLNHLKPLRFRSRLALRFLPKFMSPLLPPCPRYRVTIFFWRTSPFTLSKKSIAPFSQTLFASYCLKLLSPASLSTPFLIYSFVC